jgi:hypothetical protein
MSARRGAQDSPTATFKSYFEGAITRVPSFWSQIPRLVVRVGDEYKLPISPSWQYTRHSSEGFLHAIFDVMYLRDGAIFDVMYLRDGESESLQ